MAKESKLSEGYNAPCGYGPAGQQELPYPFPFADARI